MTQDDLSSAWALLTHRPLPGREARLTPGAVRAVAVAGAAIGLLVIVAVALLRLAAGERPGAAALLCAFLIQPAYWWLTRLTGLHALIWGSETVCRAALEDRDVAYASYWTMLVFQGAVLLKLLATGFLVYHDRGAWLALAPILGSALYAELLLKADPELQPEHEPTRLPLHWLVSGIAAAVVGVLAKGLVPALLTFGAVLLLTAWGGRAPGGLAVAEGERSRRAAVELVELLVLLLGVVFAAGLMQL